MKNVDIHFKDQIKTFFMKLIKESELKKKWSELDGSGPKIMVSFYGGKKNIPANLRVVVVSVVSKPMLEEQVWDLIQSLVKL